MTQPRNGCGDDRGEASETALCQVCKEFDDYSCSCEPCDDCAETTAVGGLNKGRDGRTRCASCHLQADLKMCAERPAFRPSLSDFYVRTIEILAGAR